MAKIVVFVPEKEEGDKTISMYHVNKADLKGRRSGRTGLFLGDLSASKYHSSHYQAIFRNIYMVILLKNLPF